MHGQLSYCIGRRRTVGGRSVGSRHGACQVLTGTDRLQTPTHPHVRRRLADLADSTLEAQRFTFMVRGSWLERRSPQYQYCVSGRQGECYLMTSDWVGELETGGPGAATGTDSGTGSAKPAAYTYTYKVSTDRRAAMRSNA